MIQVHGEAVRVPAMLTLDFRRTAVRKADLREATAKLWQED